MARKKHDDSNEDFVPLGKDAAPSKRDAEVVAVFERKKKPTVLYIGRIPHGFYEEEMRGFFSQFGTIKNLKISRNKKSLTQKKIDKNAQHKDLTGKARHYGFIEFESPEVAKIVADCMHNYLLYEHVLQVHLVPPENVPSKLWAGSKRKFKFVNYQRIEMKRHNQAKTKEQQKRLMKAILRKDRKRKQLIEAAGINYDYPQIMKAIPPGPKKIKFDDVQD